MVICFEVAKWLIHDNFRGHISVRLPGMLQTNVEHNDIKRSYKKLALTHHPDKNAEDPRATRKFQELSEAYTYLMKRTDAKSFPK
ncbi:hypothetical protein LSAT2_030636 [Lamellibrachia satsuma]|nr:hypothetical protein LSAT2_030636 [Lamellibrachia satsuma]